MTELTGAEQTGDVLTEDDAAEHEIAGDEPGRDPSTADGLGEESAHSDPELTLVFETSNPALTALARSLLESEGIEYVTQDDMMHGLGVHAGPLKFWVRGDESERAREILQDLREASRQEESIRPEDGQ